MVKNHQAGQQYSEVVNEEQAGLLGFLVRHFPLSSLGQA
jgi:hypothetical protein